MSEIEKIIKGIKTLEDDPLAVREIIEEICKTQDKLNELIDAVNKLATHKEGSRER